MQSRYFHITRELHTKGGSRYRGVQEGTSGCNPHPNDPHCKLKGGLLSLTVTET